MNEIDRQLGEEHFRFLSNGALHGLAVLAVAALEERWDCRPYLYNKSRDNYIDELALREAIATLRTLAERKPPHGLYGWLTAADVRFAFRKAYMEALLREVAPEVAEPTE